ncbi:MAG: deoxyribodipyrimidine photo-lyase [Aigarchaeota archaeon]|nr:deoxyribodipyrimidine photo-lyase [Aigarchaeota archaeon]MDW8093290.1 deoxyribodipyrimidine photo-lyase [Nitrososphaerota archaeon]
MEIVPRFINAERIKVLREGQDAERGDLIVYVMYASHRVSHNYALEYAIHEANLHRRPVIVVFPLIEKKPFPNLRRFSFMLENLIKMRRALAERGVRMFVCKNYGFLSLLGEASLVVVDRPYLSHQRRFIDTIVENAESKVVMVEGDVVVPIEAASQRPEHFARTIRPKILGKLKRFLEELPAIPPKVPSLSIDLPSWDADTVEEYVKGLEIDHTVRPVGYFVGGEDEASRRLDTFVNERLDLYARNRSDPGAEVCSELSPYLRWGMTSPVQILRVVLMKRSLEDVNVQSFINELVVWRELARNAAVYNPYFGTYDGLPGWARGTLEAHSSDRREHTYTIQELERGETHDEYWNAAQRELLTTGKIHNYMRMYWCKKIIEWTEHPQMAFECAVYLNDKYGLDGVDPNSYLGISWCFGAFDKPFFESKVYGKVRRMTQEALRRRPGIKRYLHKYSN